MSYDRIDNMNNTCILGAFIICHVIAGSLDKNKIRDVWLSWWFSYSTWTQFASLPIKTYKIYFKKTMILYPTCNFA